MDSIFKCFGLTKAFGTTRAVNNVDLELPKGRIIGLLGPNGSGKTTLIKMAAGLLTPTRGEIFIDGMKPGVETKSVVSYLPERTYFNSWMRVADCLDYFEDFYADFDRVVAVEMLQRLGVERGLRLSTLSKGTKEKVQLVMVMSRKAKLYLLDEPIGGVDPATRDYILSTIISNYNTEATVLISTHLIADIERILDEFIFIQNGEIMAYAPTENLRMDMGKSIDEYFREVFKC